MQEPSHDRVRRWVRLDRPTDQVWAAIGAFTAIADWHPMIASAEPDEIAGAPYRYLKLVDGEVFLEELLETGPHHYVYRIADSPLPADDIRVTFSCVAEADGGCHVFWSAVFEATDPMADEIVEGIFEAGLRALADRFAD